MPSPHLDSGDTAGMFVELLVGPFPPVVRTPGGRVARGGVVGSGAADVPGDRINGLPERVIRRNPALLLAAMPNCP